MLYLPSRLVMRSSSDQAQIAAQIVLLVRSSKATSRRVLSEEARLSPTTAGMYADELIRRGFLHESGLERGGMGRPKRLLTVNPSAGWFIGLEFNADRAQAIAVDFAGQAIGSRMIPLPRDAEAEQVLVALSELMRQLRAQVDTKAPLLGIGVGAPGLVEPAQGVALYYAFVPGWKDVPIGERFRNEFGVPVTVENNLRAIALAERWYGDGRDLQDYVILGPRSGFGVAMVNDGKLVHGARWAAGEIGRWPWPLNAGTGGSEVHHMLSAPMVYRRLAALSDDAPVPEDLRTAFAKFTKMDCDVWNGVIQDFGRLIGCLHVLLDAEIYLLHGPLTALGERFCNGISSAAEAICPGIPHGTLRVVPSSLGDNAGALGAASLAMEAWTPTEVG